MRSLRFMSVVLLALSVAAGAGLLRQREARSALQEEIDQLRHENQQLGRVRAENLQLKQAQLPDVALQQLRADHAALIRLRTELDTLKARADKMARQEREAAAVK